MQSMIYRDEVLLTACDNATWRSGLEHCFYDNHDRKVDGSTPNLLLLLRPWIRCFTLIISAWWNLASDKLSKSEAKFNRKTRKQRQLLSKSGFVLSRPSSLSRDKRMKMKKAIISNASFFTSYLIFLVHWPRKILLQSLALKSLSHCSQLRAVKNTYKSNSRKNCIAYTSTRCTLLNFSLWKLRCAFSFV